MRRVILTATAIAILGAGLILPGCGCWGTWHRSRFHGDDHQGYHEQRR